MAELKMKSNTVSAVDLFKCIFAICVVAIHVRPVIQFVRKKLY